MQTELNLADIPSIAEGIAALTAYDSDFRLVLETNGPLEFTLKPGGFSGLLRIILGQQVSVLAAASIWRKLQDFTPVTPEAIANISDESLRACGLSGSKSRYAKALAQDILTGKLDLQSLERLGDDEAIALLTRTIGIGRWTAENYLLFCCARSDIFPAKDLAILIGLEWLKGFSLRPTPITADAYAEQWRPHRSAASLLLWHHYIADVQRRRKVKKDL